MSLPEFLSVTADSLQQARKAYEERYPVATKTAATKTPAKSSYSNPRNAAMDQGHGKPTPVDNTQLARQQPAAVTAANSEVPEHLRAMMGVQSGFEEAEKDDFVLPRLSICQALTPQRQKANANYIKGLEEGDLFNTVSGKIYAKAGDDLRLVPLFLTKQRIKFLQPIGSGIDCQSLNGKNGGRLNPASCRGCRFSQWAGEDGPECTEFKNLVVLVEGDTSPVVFSNKSTSITIVKQWLSMMQMLNLPMFARTYRIRTLSTTKNTNTFYTYNYAPDEFVPQPVFERCRVFFESLHDKDITFNPDDMAAEAGGGGYQDAGGDGPTY